MEIFLIKMCVFLYNFVLMNIYFTRFQYYKAILQSYQSFELSVSSRMCLLITVWISQFVCFLLIANSSQTAFESSSYHYVYFCTAYHNYHIFIDINVQIMIYLS
jgi:hypothetical protein